MTGLILIGLVIFVIDARSDAVAPPMSETPGSNRPQEIRLGAHISAEGIRGAPAEAGILDRFAWMVGGQPDIVETFKTPSKTLLTPVVTVEPFLPGRSERTIPFRKIISGAWDDKFRREARNAREFPGEMMIRFAQEMNGSWYGWSGKPAAFIAAWRHVISVFRREGATNVKWIWSPNINRGYPFVRYFPGEAWVDYVGLDGYNWGTEGPGADRWLSFSGVFLHSYEELTALSSRPVIISETASGEFGGSKATWIKRAFLHEIPNRFPRVVAVIWFDYNKEEDWRVDSSRSSLNAFRRVVASPLYRLAQRPLTSLSP